MGKNTKKIFISLTMNKNTEILFPKENQVSFQKSFSYLRQKLQIKLSRKIFIDSFLKKCNSQFFRAIHECLQKCSGNGFVKKIPQTFITNITIKINKYFLNQTLFDLYKSYYNFPENVELFIKEGNCMKGKEHLLSYLYNCKISKLYSMFIKSKRYKIILKNIKNNLGVKMTILYQFVAENFLNYYYYTKAHSSRKRLIKKN